MFKNFFQLYQAGKELGLKKKEIRNIFLPNNPKRLIFFATLIIIITIVFGILMAVFFLGTPAVKDTYPTGSYYSTAKNKDFKGRKRIRLKILI
ncbi:MAG: hypothetical protein ACW986_09810 [Promethearchaeota archaeon]